MAAQTIGVSSSQSTNEGANQSTVSVTMTLYSNGWSFDGYSTSYGIRIGDAWYTGTATRTLYNPNSWSVSASRTYTHDANGYRGDVTTEAYFDGTGPYMPDYLSAGGPTQGAINYDRRPGSPAISVSRSVASVTATLSAVSSPAGTATYFCERSENSGAWGDSKTGQSVSFSGLTLGSTQQFRSYASNSDGSSGYTYSSVVSIPNVPSAPSSISATTPSALSTTISIGTSTNGGSAVTAYYVQASVDDGVTWGTPQLMTNQSFTYTTLTPGATYKFRAYAVNEMGIGAYATTPSTFVPAGGKRWTGSTFLATAIAKRWNGTQWLDLTIAKRWTGSQWVDLS